MTTAPKVAVLIGSLRKDSLSRKLALALAPMAAPDLELRAVEIGDLPFYNADLEAAPPAAWLRLRREILACDALLFVTPEYNRSVPAALKNALDVGSRPYGKAVFGGKPGAIVSVSPGALGAFGANHHLRQSLVFLNVPTLQQPEAYIGGADKLFDAEGRLANETTSAFMLRFLAAFKDWIAANAPR